MPTTEGLNLSLLKWNQTEFFQSAMTSQGKCWNKGKNGILVSTFEDMVLLLFEQRVPHNILSWLPDIMQLALRNEVYSIIAITVILKKPHIQRMY